MPLRSTVRGRMPRCGRPLGRSEGGSDRGRSGRLARKQRDGQPRRDRQHHSGRARGPEGPPQYAPIERTRLLYVTNSPDRLFLDLSTQQHYVLLAGRWFRTRSLTQGPWEHVPGTASAQTDFAMIPVASDRDRARRRAGDATGARSSNCKLRSASRDSQPQRGTASTSRMTGRRSFVRSKQRRSNTPSTRRCR